MVDEKTVMASGPLSTPVGGQAPQTFGKRMAFMWPGLVIVLLLAVGVSYWILYTVNNDTLEKLSVAKNELVNKNRELEEKIKQVDTANKDLKNGLDDAKAANAKLEDAVKKMDTALKETTGVLDGLSKLSIPTFMETTKKDVKDVKEDVKKHEGNLAEINQRIKYIDDRLKKLDELATDVNGLKIDTTDLKKEYGVLRTDMTNVQKKEEITEQDLANLDERARLFQLRVLAARAREAADYARKMDLKALLNRLDDVEDKK